MEFLYGNAGVSMNKVEDRGIKKQLPKKTFAKQ